MAKTKHPPLIADIEPNIALSNAIAIEREQCLPIAVPVSKRTACSLRQQTRIAPSMYIRQLLGRSVTALPPWGRPKIAEAPCQSAHDPLRPR